MFNLFNDIFTYNANATLKTDPRNKLIVSLWVIVLVVCSKGVIFPGAVFMVCLTLMMLLHIPARMIAGRLLVPLGIVMVIILLKLFMTPGDLLFTVSFAKITLAASQAGLLEGVILGTRVMGSCSMIIFLGVTTPAHDVFRSMLWMKAPREWVEVAMLMCRYIFVLIDTAINMLMAQKLRLGYSGMWRSLHSVGVLSGAVVLRSVDQAVKTSEAMILRGYNGAFPVSRLACYKRRDFTVTLLVCGFMMVFFGVFEWVLV